MAIGKCLKVTTFYYNVFLTIYDFKKVKLCLLLVADLSQSNRKNCYKKLRWVSNTKLHLCFISFSYNDISTLWYDCDCNVHCKADWQPTKKWFISCTLYIQNVTVCFILCL